MTSNYRTPYTKLSQFPNVLIGIVFIIVDWKVVELFWLADHPAVVAMVLVMVMLVQVVLEAVLLVGVARKTVA